MNAPDFSNRWLIRGRLRTLSELHIGDGGSGGLYDRHRPPQKDEIATQTVCVDAPGRAFIPGSSIKGILRSSLDPRHSNVWTELFGSIDASALDAVGGKLSFFDAFLLSPNSPNNFSSSDPNRNQTRLARQPDSDLLQPYWDPVRHTCVATSVSIDRRTRTAEDQLLFHHEYVPPGTDFEVTLAGEGLSPVEVQTLLDQINQAASEATPLTMGGRGSRGWGRMTWRLEGVHMLEREGLSRWIADGAPSTGWSICTTHGHPWAYSPNKVSAERSHVTFDLRLEFSGPLLVRDARQADRVAEWKKTHGDSNHDDRHRPTGKQKETAPPPTAVPMKNAWGTYQIPGPAVAGVLRSHAERILRTLGQEIPAHHEQPTFSTEEGPAQMNLIALLFGVPGWKAPFTCNTLATAILPQEFAAIDRFTGSVAGHKKFKTEAIVGAEMSGTLSLHLHRLPESRRTEALHLLSLLFRDLTEQDLCFGSGAAKGYGLCTTASGTVSSPDDPPTTLDAWVQSHLSRSAAPGPCHA